MTFLSDDDDDGDSDDGDGDDRPRRCKESLFHSGSAPEEISVIVSGLSMPFIVNAGQRKGVALARLILDRFPYNFLKES